MMKMLQQYGPAGRKLTGQRTSNRTYPKLICSPLSPALKAGDGKYGDSRIFKVPRQVIEVHGDTAIDFRPDLKR